MEQTANGSPQGSPLKNGSATNSQPLSQTERIQFEEQIYGLNQRQNQLETHIRELEVKLAGKSAAEAAPQVTKPAGPSPEHQTAVKRIAELEASNADLERKLKAQEVQLGQLSAQFGETEQHLTALQAVNAAQSNAFEEIQSLKKAHAETITRMEAEYLEEAESKYKIEEELKALRENSELAEAGLLVPTTEVEELKKQLTASEEARKALDAQVLRLKADHENQLKEKQGAIEAIEAAKAKLQEELGKLQAKKDPKLLQDTQAARDEAIARLRKANGELEALRPKLQEALAEVTRLQGELEGVAEKCATFTREQLKGITAELAEKNQALADAQKLLEQERARAATLDQDLTAANRLLEGAGSELQELQKKSAEQAERLENLEKELTLRPATLRSDAERILGELKALAGQYEQALSTVRAPEPLIAVSAPPPITISEKLETAVPSVPTALSAHKLETEIKRRQELFEQLSELEQSVEEPLAAHRAKKKSLETLITSASRRDPGRVPELNRQLDAVNAALEPLEARLTEIQTVSQQVMQEIDQLKPFLAALERLKKEEKILHLLGKELPALPSLPSSEAKSEVPEPQVLSSPSPTLRQGEASTPSAPLPTASLEAAVLARENERRERIAVLKGLAETYGLTVEGLCVITLCSLLPEKARMRVDKLVGIAQLHGLFFDLGVSELPVDYVVTASRDFRGNEEQRKQFLRYVKYNFADKIVSLSQKPNWEKRIPDFLPLEKIQQFISAAHAASKT